MNDQTPGLCLIVEGIDGSGKSTLIEKLSKRFNCLIIKSRNRPTGSDDTHLKHVYDRMRQIAIQNRLTCTTIFDRWYPSQMVYSILRGEDSMKDNWYQYFDETLANHIVTFVIIYCKPSLETLMIRHALKPDDYIKSSHLKELLERYNKLFAITKLPVIEIETNMPLSDDKITQLIDSINFIQYKREA